LIVENPNLNNGFLLEANYMLNMVIQEFNFSDVCLIALETKHAWIWHYMIKIGTTKDRHNHYHS
jgi:hypothetical protein